MQDLKIDLVYLWVDDKDEEWQKKRRYWADKLGIMNSEENNNCRYSNNDELKYSLRSAEMYAPWVNKIFIITDGQVPKWLDTSHPKIRIVDHKEIMPEDCLPCFNSAAIEACIDNISDLSEYFLYANDDMFFASPVEPEYFYNEDNKPIINLRTRKWTEPNNIYTQRILYTQDLFNKTFGQNPTLYMSDPLHCIDVYRKSSLKSCKKLFQEEFDKLIHQKFRCPNTIQRIIFSLFMIEKNQGILKFNPPIAEQEFCSNINNLYLKLDSKYSIKDVIKKYTPKLLCINDTEDTSDEDRRKLKTILSNTFPIKQCWEIVEEFTIQPIFEGDYYSIVFSFNEEYSKYFAVTLQSIIDNSSKDEKYDLVIFHSDISLNSQRLLNKMIPKNFSLRFFDISSYISNNFPSINLKTMNNWSVEIYNRIFIPLLMSTYNKVLYLDSDIVVNGNLKELFNIDFDNKQILAVKDATAQILHLKEFSERKKHIKEYLQLEKEKDYFNSGMIMFNISSINKDSYNALVERAFKKENLLYPDQDILNIIFKNSVKFVSSKWNFCCGIFIWNKSFIESLNGDYLYDVQSSFSTPIIVHYTSPQKPWNSSLELHYEIFWKYARKTPFYENILLEMNREIALKTIIEGAKFSNLYLQVQSGKKIILWGASLFLEEFMQKYDILSPNIIGIIDKNINKQGTFLRQYKIFAPEDLIKLKPEKIIITIVNSVSEKTVEIKEFLKKQNIVDVEVINI